LEPVINVLVERFDESLNKIRCNQPITILKEHGSVKRFKISVRFKGVILDRAGLQIRQNYQVTYKEIYVPFLKCVAGKNPSFKLRLHKKVRLKHGTHFAFLMYSITE